MITKQGYDYYKINWLRTVVNMLESRNCLYRCQTYNLRRMIVHYSVLIFTVMIRPSLGHLLDFLLASNTSILGKTNKSLIQGSVKATSPHITGKILLN